MNIKESLIKMQNIGNKKSPLNKSSKKTQYWVHSAELGVYPNPASYCLIYWEVGPRVHCLDVLKPKARVYKDTNVESFKDAIQTNILIPVI